VIAYLHRVTFRGHMTLATLPFQKILIGHAQIIARNNGICLLNLEVRSFNCFGAISIFHPKIGVTSSWQCPFVDKF